MEKIKRELVDKIKKYIEIIKKEYPDLIKVNGNNLEDKVHIEDTGTISLFVKRGEFYFELERTMEMEFNSKYMSYKYPGVMGPFNKTKNYEMIDYSRAYELLDEYKKSIGSDTLCQR